MKQQAGGEGDRPPALVKKAQALARAAEPAIGTVKQVELGARLAGTTDSIRSAGVGVYSQSVLDNPGRNGLVRGRLVDAAIRAGRLGSAKTLHDLKPAATARLKEILEDREESAAVVGSIAIAVHRVTSEIPPDAVHEGHSVSRGRLKLHLAKLRWLVRGLRAPAEIREILMRQAEARIEEATERLAVLSDAGPGLVSRRGFAERDR